MQLGPRELAPWLVLGARASRTLLGLAELVLDDVTA